MTPGAFIASLTIVVLGASTAEETLRGAIEEFEFGEHARAARTLISLLDPVQLSSKEDVILARQYLGACELLLGNRERAKSEFGQILALDPDHRIDPGVFSPALVQLFDEVKTRSRLASPPPTPPAADTASMPAAEPPMLALAFVPLGVGQFNNQHPIRGALFAGSEVALFAASIATYVLFRGVVSQHASETGGSLVFEESEQRYADQANVLQSAHVALFWSGIALAGIGVLEALISYPGSHSPIESATCGALPGVPCQQ